MNPPPAKPQFLLLLHQPAGGAPPPEELQKIMARFTTWIEGLRAKGMVLGSNGLEDSGTVLRGPHGESATDGPYLETKEIVGGYLLITAENWDAAVAAGRACPGLDYRMAVEVRPVRIRVDS